MRAALMMLCSVLLGSAMAHADPLVQVSFYGMVDDEYPVTYTATIDPAAFTHPSDSPYLSADYIYEIDPLTISLYTYDRLDLAFGLIGGGNVLLFSGALLSPTDAYFLQTNEGFGSCPTLAQNVSGAQVPTFGDDSCDVFSDQQDPSVSGPEFTPIGLVNFTAAPSTVTPEPASLMLLGSGLLAAGAVWRRRRV